MHLHIGLAPKSLNRFFRSLSSYSSDVNGRLSYTIDGDGWNVWGEGVDVNGNDPSTLHIIVNVNDEEQANEVLALAPMFVRHKDGFDALLTDRENWQIVYQTFPDNLPGQVPNGVLKHLNSLRSYGHAAAEESHGETARQIYEYVDDSYEEILRALQHAYKQQGFVSNVVFGDQI